MPKRQHDGRDSPLPYEDWQGEVERIAWGGKCIGRLADGRVVLLSSGLALFPGEIVTARIQVKSRHAEGEVTGYVTRDPRRVDAGCTVAAHCGACSLWESGEATAELKQMIAADLLHRQLRDAPDMTWLPAPPGTRRSRIQLHWDGRHLGYHRQHGHSIVAVDACPMAATPLSQAMPLLTDALRSGVLPDAPDRWELATGTPVRDVCAVASPEPEQAWWLEGDEWKLRDQPLIHELGGERIEQPPDTFFQACPAWAWEALSGTLRGWNIHGDTLFDLYGGCGFFSVMLKDVFQRFVLVESAAASIAAAERNLVVCAIGNDNCQLHCAAVDEWLRDGLGKADDVVLLDPPRAGVGMHVIDKLRTAKAKALILIGCDGMVFCRDAKLLAEHWQLTRLTAIDLFPNTPIIEFVGMLVRRDSN